MRRVLKLTTYCFIAKLNNRYVNYNLTKELEPSKKELYFLKELLLR